MFLLPSTMPWVKSSLAFIGMLGFYFLSLALLSGSWSFTWSQFIRYWWLIIPISITFAAQVSLASTATSTTSMLACCAHHVAELLPFLGLFSAASFLVRYQVSFMIFALALNLFFLLKSRLRYAKRSEISAISGQNKKTPGG